MSICEYGGKLEFLFLLQKVNVPSLLFRRLMNLFDFKRYLSGRMNFILASECEPKISNTLSMTLTLNYNQKAIGCMN